MSSRTLAQAIEAEALRRSIDVQSLRDAAGAVTISQLPAELFATKRLVHQAFEIWTGTAMSGARTVATGAAFSAAMWAGASADYGNDGSALAAFPFDPADFEVVGKSLRLTTRLSVVTNGTVPFRTFNGYLHSPGASGGGTGGHLTLAAGTDVTGSTASVAASTGTANSKLLGSSSAYAAPAAGHYAPRVALGDGLPANAVVAVRWALYAHNI